MTNRNRSRVQDDKPMDPVALTLAVWLGLIVCVTGAIRMSERASAQALLNQVAQGAVPGVGTPLDPLAPGLRLYAFGG